MEYKFLRDYPGYVEYMVRQIPVNQCKINPLAQRQMQIRRAAEIVNNFDPIGATIISAVYDPSDDAYYVTDGQHQVEVYRRLGIMHIEAMVYSILKMPLERQAEQFLKRSNTGAVKSLDKFNVAVTAKHSIEEGVNLLLLRYEYVPGSSGKRGNIAAVKALVSMARERQGSIVKSTPQGLGIVDNVLYTIKKAWDDNPEGVRGTILAGLGWVYSRNLQPLLLTSRPNREELAESLSGIMPNKLLADADAQKGHVALPKSVYNSVLREYYRTHKIAYSKRMPLYGASW